MTDPALMIDRIAVDLTAERSPRRVLRDVSLNVGQGESVGLIGESGSGKSMTIRAAARLLPTGARATGAVRIHGRDILGMDGAELRRLRSGHLGLIFQDPKAHINPVRRIGDFLTEGMLRIQRMNRSDAVAKAVSLLQAVGIDDGRRVIDSYPHQVSGGMLQRIMIASVIAAEPSIILADEPTTALDVTRQAEVVAILNRMRRDRDIGLLFVTHDLELAAAICDRIVVMYAGTTVESMPASDIGRARHPYTRALLGARPDVNRRLPSLPAVPGQPISGLDAPDGCAFAARCPHARDQCRTELPQLEEHPTGSVRCLRADEPELATGGPR